MAVKFDGTWNTSAQNYVDLAKEGQKLWGQQIANGGINSSENQAAINELRQDAETARKADVASAALMGSTDAAKAMARNARAKEVSDGMAAIAKNATSQEREAMNNYLNVMAQGAQGTAGVTQNKRAEDLQKWITKKQAQAATTAAIINGVASVAGSAVDLLKK